MYSFFLYPSPLPLVLNAAECSTVVLLNILHFPNTILVIWHLWIVLCISINYCFDQQAHFFSHFFHSLLLSNTLVPVKVLSCLSQDSAIHDSLWHSDSWMKVTNEQITIHALLFPVKISQCLTAHKMEITRLHATHLK